jgi:hypothetical protein
MKRVLSIIFVCSVALFSCKKKENTVSQLVSYSKPTISITGGEYYSINVGDALPTISSSAYDSFYREAYPVVIDQSSLDNTKPGLNIVYISAKNKYGMVEKKAIYIAVTNVSDTFDFSGNYRRLSNLQEVSVDKLARGLYRTNNVGGVLDIPDNQSVIVPAYFVQTNDTTLVMPEQQTSLGTLSAVNFSFSYPAPTTYQYVVRNLYFSGAVRVFERF